jgi:hypothetical protein
MPSAYGEQARHRRAIALPDTAQHGYAAPPQATARSQWRRMPSRQLLCNVFRPVYRPGEVAAPGPAPRTIPNRSNCPPQNSDDTLQPYERPAGPEQVDVSVPSLDAARAAIVANGFEVFRVKGDTIQLAERVRLHLMDASVSVSFGERPRIEFTVRVQNSDFPGAEAEEMFGKVRQATASRAEARGFTEFDRRCRSVNDPIDSSRVLDVWYELIFAKDTQGTSDLEQLIDDLRWALSVSKCVSH